MNWTKLTIRIAIALSIFTSPTPEDFENTTAQISIRFFDNKLPLNEFERILDSLAGECTPLSSILPISNKDCLEINHLFLDREEEILKIKQHYDTADSIWIFHRYIEPSQLPDFPTYLSRNFTLYKTQDIYILRSGWLHPSGLEASRSHFLIFGPTLDQIQVEASFQIRFPCLFDEDNSLHFFRVERNSICTDLPAGSSNVCFEVESVRVGANPNSSPVKWGRIIEIKENTWRFYK